MKLLVKVPGFLRSHVHGMPGLESNRFQLFSPVAFSSDIGNMSISWDFEGISLRWFCSEEELQLDGMTGSDLYTFSEV